MFVFRGSITRYYKKRLTEFWFHFNAQDFEAAGLQIPAMFKVNFSLINIATPPPCLFLSRRSIVKSFRVTLESSIVLSSLV